MTLITVAGLTASARKERHHHHAEQVDHHRLAASNAISHWLAIKVIRAQSTTAIRQPRSWMRHLSVNVRLSGARLGNGVGLSSSATTTRSVGRTPGQFVGKRFAAKPAPVLATANDNFAQVVLTRVAQNGFIFLRIGEGRGFRPSSCAGAANSGSRDAGFLAGREAAAFRHTPRARRCQISQPAGRRYGQAFIAATVTNAQQDGIPRMPDAFLSCRSRRTHLVIHAIGGAAQGQFAQGDQVAFTKEVFDSAFGPAI